MVIILHGFNYVTIHEKEQEMGMNREDAYYEPEDSDDHSDEIEARAWELMKVGAKYDYRTTQAINEALGELDRDTDKALQEVLDMGDYKAIGRKIISIAYDFMERYAVEQAENEILD